jgi:hypothetical protein
VDIGLRNALLAKTILRDGKITRNGLMITSVQKAKHILENNNNIGHRHNKVIYDKSIKIFKNLLKQYSEKQLVKIFLIRNMKSFDSKNKTIELIVKLSENQIKSIIKGE